MTDQLIDDRFEVLSLAARGAMGSVYRARDRSTGREVAVKVSQLGGEVDRARFTREANLLALLEHDAVVRYIAHGMTTDGAQYLAQEWVEGISLRVQLRSFGVSAAEAIAIGLGLSDALSAAHALAIVHRDVKPENVILAGGKAHAVKLVDFGIARMTDAAMRLTRTGTVIGTPSYMSPEQARGAQIVGPPSDVWATGCVLYELLAGHQAFSGRSPMAVRARVLLDTPAPLAIACPEAPMQIIDLVERMLARTAAGRPTIAEVREVLAAAKVGDGPRRLVAEPASPDWPRETVELSPAGALGCFVFFTSTETDLPSEARAAIVDEIAQRHQLDPHPFEDGSVLFAPRDAGKPAALAAARAALDLYRALPGSAITIVAHRAGGPVAATFERGAQSLDRLTMAVLFGEGVVHGIRLDPDIAELISDEHVIEMQDGAPMLIAKRE